MARLLKVSVASSTLITYRRALGVFRDFQISVGIPPTDPMSSSASEVAQFVAFLSLRGCAPGIVASYLSGLAFWLRVSGLRVTRTMFGEEAVGGIEEIRNESGSVSTHFARHPWEGSGCFAIGLFICIRGHVISSCVFPRVLCVFEGRRGGCRGGQSLHH